ncbi:MAG: hypothetical protein NZ739_10435 [Verrucomicrobiae bacterium]|nr:hypothetical protein [Verrucomicrobiae bacterium]
MAPLPDDANLGHGIGSDRLACRPIRGHIRANDPPNLSNARLRKEKLASEAWLGY